MQARIQVCAMVALFVLGAACPARADSACWDLAYSAIRHRAAAPHPQFILYDAAGTIIQDGAVLLRTQAAVAYRDDGVALIADDRFTQPYVSKSIDPGPPELGPYSGRRSNWLLPDEMDPSFRVIAKVHAAHQLPCTNRGIVRFGGRDAYDLVFGSPSQHRAGLQEMWVDAKSSEIWKVVLRAYEDPLDPGAATQSIPVDYAIELEQSGPYFVVHHITWNYAVKEYSQSSTISGEYYYSDFRFPAQLPATYFAG